MSFLRKGNSTVLLVVGLILLILGLMIYPNAQWANMALVMAFAGIIIAIVGAIGYVRALSKSAQAPVQQQPSAQPTAFCSKCGKPVEGQFCKSCGAKIG
jgi:uncharacterized membrane protein HdeD (DUF308 family)